MAVRSFLDFDYVLVICGLLIICASYYNSKLVMEYETKKWLWLKMYLLYCYQWWCLSSYFFFSSNNLDNLTYSFWGSLSWWCSYPSSYGEPWYMCGSSWLKNSTCLTIRLLVIMYTSLLLLTIFEVLSQVVSRTGRFTLSYPWCECSQKVIHEISFMVRS